MHQISASLSPRELNPSVADGLPSRSASNEEKRHHSMQRSLMSLPSDLIILHHIP